MTMNSYKTLIGIQGSVMGWDDPWHRDLCKKYMRTGERQYFPSQDITPDPELFIKLIKSMGVDFYMHQVMPEQKEIDRFIDSIEALDMPYFLGNEYGSINKANDGINNRYDVPDECVKKAGKSKNFLGLFYDETEHLQLHPDIYQDNQKDEFKEKPPAHQWTSTEGKELETIENEVTAAVRKRLEDYGGNIPVFSEHVFPVMYHTLARGGMNLCPKVMKEEFQSIQLATALGASKQYKRKMGICVDLWGPDVGNWFTRLWGFPGHSPAEYKSALEMAYLMGPEFLFTENVDPLAVYRKEGFLKTEFGDVFECFIKKFVRNTPRNYNHSMVDPDIAIIRSDDTAWSEHGGFNGRGLYGSMSVVGDFRAHSVFKIFHLLSRGTTPQNGIIHFLPQLKFPAGRYVRNNENVKLLPLVNGIEDKVEDYAHTLFYPMNNVAVFDERVDEVSIGNPKLIFVAGSRITEGCLKAVDEKVKSGAVCICASWLMPKDFRYECRSSMGKWIVTDDFLSDTVKDEVEAFLGEKDCWMQRFGDYEVRFYNPDGDGVTLTHEVRHVK